MKTANNLTFAKKSFLSYELGLLTMKAALSTRDSAWPIYCESKKMHQRMPVQNAIRKILQNIEIYYSTQTVSEDQHIHLICNTANILSEDFKSFLFNGRFRIGIAQKLVNLHLKYLWVASAISEPPHCPLDGIVRDLAGINYNWTKNDSISEYKDAITSLRKIATPRSLSEWELCEFRRPAQNIINQRSATGTTRVASTLVRGSS